MEDKQLLTQLIELEVDGIKLKNDKFELSFENGDAFLIDSELSDYDKCLLLRWLRERSRSYGWTISLAETGQKLEAIATIYKGEVYKEEKEKREEFKIIKRSPNLETAFLLSFIDAIKSIKIDIIDMPEYFGDDEYGATIAVVHKDDWVDKRRFAIAVLEEYNYDYKDTFLGRFFDEETKKEEAIAYIISQVKYGYHLVTNDPNCDCDDVCEYCKDKIVRFVKKEPNEGQFYKVTEWEVY